MIIWILMLLDIVAFVSLSLAHFHIAFATPVLIFSIIYLAIKFPLFKDFMSAIDFAVAVYLLIVVLFHVSSFLYYIAAAWFVYKIVFTIIQF